MQLAGHQAERIHGTLTVELADGRQAHLDIDVDVSDPRSLIEVQDHHDDEDFLGRWSSRPRRVVSQTLAIHWPAPTRELVGEPSAPLTIRVPTT